MSKVCIECKKLLESELFRKGHNQCKKCEILKRKCIHNKIKSRCKECGGGTFCDHGKRKSNCKECGGGSICEHNKIKTRCIDCKGGSICEHQKRRNVCKECEGGSICEHKKRKYECIECDGNSVCEHYKIKYKCVSCNPSLGCSECKSIYVYKSSLYYPLCQACFCNKYPDNEKSTLYKIKERYFRDELRERFPDKDIIMIFDKTVNGGCSKRRPDVLIDLLLYSIIIECDENQHKNYECENKRVMQLFEDLGNRPLIIIRFNPDNYLKNNKKFETCFKPLINMEDINKKKFYVLNEKEWKRRIDILEKVINENITENIPEKEITEIKLFYDEC